MKKKDSNLKVIYLAHHGLGDVITKIPAINYLISKFSRKNVFLTVQYQFIIDFISKYLHIPEKNFILFDRQNNNFSDNFSDYLKFIRFIRRQKFDYYILPPTINQKLGRGLYYISGARNKVMPEINYAVKFKHKVFRNIEFIRYFEFISDEDLVRTAEENYFLDVSSVVQQIEPFNKPFIVIHPGCGVIIEAHKKYPADKYVLLIEAMLKRYADIDIVLTGTEQEKKLNEFIFDKIDSQRLVNITARFNLDELIALFSQKNMKGIVCGDTGPAHLASVLKKPGIVMFGSTDDTVTSPFKYSCIVKTYPVLDCMPCYGTKKYGIKGCGDNQCMQTISIDKLLAKIDKIII